MRSTPIRSTGCATPSSSSSARPRPAVRSGGIASAQSPGCDICRGDTFDAEFGRAEVWHDRLWRLSTSTRAPILGFSYLEPIRHVPYISDLDGPEAETFGWTLARVTAVLKELTGADIVYALMFGDHVAHLHVNLVPHRVGDAVTGGAQLLDPAAPELPVEVHQAFVARLREATRDSLFSARERL